MLRLNILLMGKALWRERILRNNIRERFSHLNSRKVTPQAIHEMQVALLSESTLDLNYIVLILGSCAIATLGLLSNSTAVIIGAMLIAPLMLPIRGIAF